MITNVYLFNLYLNWPHSILMIKLFCFMKDTGRLDDWRMNGYVSKCIDSITKVNNDKDCLIRLKFN
jgi:hypothetical protein